jgi:type IV secretion system protein TrbG
MKTVKTVLWIALCLAAAAAQAQTPQAQDPLAARPPAAQVRQTPPAAVTAQPAPQAPPAVAAYVAKDKNRDIPPPVSPFQGSTNPPLTQKERQGVAYGKEWRNNRDKPARGPDGAAVYVFGATLPTVVCAPLYVCDLVLQPGEAVKSATVGDAVRWQITPAEQGGGESLITHIIIKPTDVGLITNMVITTNRRAYVIKLKSREDDWMPQISFEYPEEVKSDWRAYRARLDGEQEAREAAREAQPQGAFDYAYRISGDSPTWRPVKVYATPSKTYIQFPSSLPQGESPALLAIAEDTSFLGLDTVFNGPRRQIVNYRLIGDRIEVDKVLTHAVLVSGVGSAQTSVEIVHEGGQ